MVTLFRHRRLLTTWLVVLVAFGAEAISSASAGREAAERRSMSSAEKAPEVSAAQSPDVMLAVAARHRNPACRPGRRSETMVCFVAIPASNAPLIGISSPAFLPKAAAVHVPLCLACTRLLI
jgi:hypothetical protein